MHPFPNMVLFLIKVCHVPCRSPPSCTIQDWYHYSERPLFQRRGLEIGLGLVRLRLSLGLWLVDLEIVLLGLWLVGLALGLVGYV